VTANEATRAEAGGSHSNNEIDAAKKLLSELLADGPVLRNEVDEAAKANCISRRTMGALRGNLASSQRSQRA
jgi:hypothetical protein